MTQNVWDNFQTDINEPFESYLFKGTFIKKKTITRIKVSKYCMCSRNLLWLMLSPVRRFSNHFTSQGNFPNNSSCGRIFLCLKDSTIIHVAFLRFTVP